MKRSHPTILNPIHYENVRQPSDHLNIYFMHLEPDRLLSAVHIRAAAASRGIYGFSRHISHSLLYQLSHIQSLYSTNVCHIYSSHICIPLHIKKKRSCIETPSFTQVCSYPVIGFSRAPFGKGYLGGYLIERIHEFDPSNFSPIISFVLHLLERLRNMGPGKGRAVVIICFYVYNLRGGLPYIIIVFRLRMIQRSPGRSLFCVCLYSKG